MASRLANLRNTLQSSTASIVRDGAKIAEYSGPTIGARTSGNYGALPKPLPVSYFFKQEYNLKWALAVSSLGMMMVSAWIPVWAIPFYSKMAKDYKKVDEEFGPTRYGAGKKFSL